MMDTKQSPVYMEDRKDDEYYSAASKYGFELKNGSRTRVSKSLVSN